MSDKNKTGEISATIETSMEELADNHEPRLNIIEAGSSHTELAKQLDGKLVEVTPDGLSIVEPK